MRDGDGLSKEGIIFCFGPFQPAEVVLQNWPEKWIFWLFSNTMFLESWDQTRNESVGIFRIRGHSRSWEVIKGQILKRTEPIHVIPFWKALEVSMRCWCMPEATRGCQRLLEAARGYQRLPEVTNMQDLNKSNSRPTFVPHMYLNWGTWGTYRLLSLIHISEPTRPY